MTTTLDINNVVHPYAHKSKAGVAWWLTTIGRYLVFIASDIATLALLWWLVGDGTDLITRLNDPRTLETSFYLLIALCAATFILLRTLSYLSRRATDSIPGAYGVVLVDKLPGLRAAELFIGVVPHAVWMLTMLIVGQHVLQVPDILLAFILAGYYSWSITAIMRATSALMVRRNAWAFSYLALASAMIIFGISGMMTLEPLWQEMILLLLVILFTWKLVIRLLRSSTTTMRESPNLGIRYQLRHCGKAKLVNR